MFSENVDASTIIDSGNIKSGALTIKTADAAATTVNPTAATLNGKTLTITVAAGATEGVHNISIPHETVKATSGKFFVASTTKVTRDTTPPTFTSATGNVASPATKATSLVLTFNEELASIQTVKIGTKSYNAVINGKTATITDTNGFTHGDAISAVNVKDKAGNVAALLTSTVAVNSDSTPPSLDGSTPLAVVSGSENKLKVKFSEKLAQTPTITATVDTFTANIVTGTELDSTDATGLTYIITLNPEYLAKATTGAVTVKVAKETAIDLAGLKNAADITSSPITLSGLDKTAPILSASVDSTTRALLLTADEAVTLAKGLADITVTKADGEIVTGTAFFDSIKLEGSIVTLTPKADTAAATYTVSVPKGLVKDASLSKNENAANASVTYVVPAVTAPFTVVSATAANNEITVNFGKKVGTSATTIGNYSLDGTALTSTVADIAYGKNAAGEVDQTKVVIKLKSGQVAVSDSAAILSIAASAITAIDGSTNKAFTTTTSVIDNVAPTVSAFTATDLTKVTFTSSEKLKITGDVTDEIKLEDSTGGTIAFTASVVEGKLVLTVADATKVAKATITALPGANLVDEAGNALAATVVLP